MNDYHCLLISGRYKRSNASDRRTANFDPCMLCSHEKGSLLTNDYCVARYWANANDKAKTKALVSTRHCIP